MCICFFLVASRSFQYIVRNMFFQDVLSRCHAKMEGITRQSFVSAGAPRIGMEKHAAVSVLGFFSVSDRT